MELTATGIVTDSHRIPFSPLVTLGYKTCNTRFLKLVTPDSKTRNARFQKLATSDSKLATPDSKLATLGAQTYNTRSVKAPCALQM